jgi:Uma2 family endonuclease
MELTLDLGPHVRLDPAMRLCLRGLRLTDGQLMEVCRRNEGWRFEREPDGELTARPLLGSPTGLRNAALTAQLTSWADRTKLGVAFGPTLGMYLPSGAVRAPAAAWLTAERWQALSLREREGFLPCCADFVAEFVSPFDERGDLLERMLEYREHGARLGWLIDPANRTVDVFRPREPIRTFENLTHLMERPDGAVLPGFVLDLRRIWNAGT